MERVAVFVTAYLGHAAEIAAAVVIAVALCKAMFAFAAASGSNQKKEAIRLQFGTSVALALELLLGADVLSTAVAPSWDDIGKLAAVAVLRTALNYFLGKELQHLNVHKFSTPEAGVKRA